MPLAIRPSFLSQRNPGWSANKAQENFVFLPQPGTPCPPGRTLCSSEIGEKGGFVRIPVPQRLAIPESDCYHLPDLRRKPFDVSARPGTHLPFPEVRQTRCCRDAPSGERKRRKDSRRTNDSVVGAQPVA